MKRDTTASEAARILGKIITPKKAHASKQNVRRAIAKKRTKRLEQFLAP